MNICMYVCVSISGWIDWQPYVMCTGDLVEFHDHTSRPGRPVVGDCGCQGEAGVGGEEEPADIGKCSEHEAAKGD